jgi:hypothetical protein
MAPKHIVDTIRCSTSDVQSSLVNIRVDEDQGGAT